MLSPPAVETHSLLFWVHHHVCIRTTILAACSQPKTEHGKSTKAGSFWQNVGLFQWATLPRTLYHSPTLFQPNSSFSLSCIRCQIYIIVRRLSLFSASFPNTLSAHCSIGYLFMHNTLFQNLVVSQNLVSNNMHLITHSYCRSGMWA